MKITSMDLVDRMTSEFGVVIHSERICNSITVARSLSEIRVGGVGAGSLDGWEQGESIYLCIRHTSHWEGGTYPPNERYVLCINI